jgi:hypothetical protein
MNENHVPEKTVEAPSILEDPSLRKYYIMELTELMGSSLWENADQDRRDDLLMGLESGFWALQKAIKRGEIKITETTTETK